MEAYKALGIIDEYAQLGIACAEHKDWHKAHKELFEATLTIRGIVDEKFSKKLNRGLNKGKENG